jgi:uncharacterized protein (DUF2384 family)
VQARDQDYSVKSILKLAGDVFQNRDKMSHWLRTPVQAFMNEQDGRKRIHTILVRTEDGVFSLLSIELLHAKFVFSLRDWPPSS